MKIKTKLLLGFSSKPLLIILLIVIGFLQVSSFDKLSNVTKNNYELSLLTEQIQREVKDEAISLRNMVIFTDKDSIQKERTILQASSDSVFQDIAELESKVKTPEQKNMVDNLKKTNKKFNEYKDKVINLVLKGQRKRRFG
ncbi:MCP four helix bundle domain-containing protein [Bacillus sp. EB600]|uniref:MCP four helix bundle domain-containing protein n=1 Tax=Bacillus sp. EB600 TaxID=2806345 RepID=UPI00210B22D0|nr:MCP four helix bundle domain-containing protein [Bacillus sp. EB600]MCQ6280494.1 MCP four helix bundle domain-containing protein [Bacillus sp. EB600]